MAAKSILDGFLAPDSICVVGASDDARKPGGKIVENIVKRGYGGELFLINPKSVSIMGLEPLPAIADLPHPPDLAYIAIPARYVADALTELADFGARRVIVLSAGFGEVDEHGRREEERLARIADAHGVALLGPNCLGVMSPVLAGKFAGLLPEMHPGGIDFISGSGATVDILSEQAVRRGLRFHSFVTVGNSAGMSVPDLLALYDREHGPGVPRHIMLYLEKIGEPRAFLQSALSLTDRGCVLMAVKSGVTEAGRRAAASHTGALAANDTAVDALFAKAGIIRLNGKLAMVDTATALALAKGHYDGRRACVITDAGGPGVMAVDELNRQGIDTPSLKPETRKQLAALLPPGAGLNNPVDLLPTRTPEQLTATLDIIAREEGDALDYILVQLGDPGFTDNWPAYRAVLDAMNRLPLPVFPSLATSISSREALDRFHAEGGCHFEDEVSMARAIGRVVNRPRPAKPAPDPAGYDGAAAARLLKGITGPVPPDLIRSVLAAAGIPLPGEHVLAGRGDLNELESILAPPWVMKVLGPLHKTELGGVIPGVTPTDAAVVFDRLMAIPGARGVLVQETVTGPEAIMGLSREGEFGHLVAFGLGGILAEALRDVAFGLAPLVPEEAGRLIRSIRTFPILEGYRGQPGMDPTLLADILTRVSLLGRDVPGIAEMDINPIKGTGQNVSAVDVRIIMG